MSRPTGSKNVKTKEWERMKDAFISKHTDRFNRIMDNSDDDKFCLLYLKTLEYFQPKMRRTELLNDTINEPHTFVIVPASSQRK
jgi:hypothetical protein